MGRRFPTPLIGVPTDPERYRLVARVAAQSRDPLEWDEFKNRCHDAVRNPETGEQYSASYLTRILSTYVEIGVVDRDNDDIVAPSPFADDFLEGELDFSEFLWNSLKRSWVAMGTKPEGIEGLDRVARVVNDKPKGLKRGEIRSALREEYEYEFNNEGIRGYPQILELLGVFEQEGKAYRIASEEVLERYKRRFRSTDVFDALEARLKREGSAVEPPSHTAKRDMMKYYMYRESGGWNKRREWYKTFWADYLTAETRAGETGDELRRRPKYRDATNRRRELRHLVAEMYDRIDRPSLSGLSTSVLERMRDAEDEREALRIQVSAGSGMTRADLELLQDSAREPYTFPDQFSLYDWQREAADRWFSAGDERAAETGIAQVVTGAGKTVMALEVMRCWLQNSEERVATIVVPTKVLLQQWLAELVSTLNVPIDEIGWAGGGHKDDFEDCRIIVSIVNSAVKNDYLGHVLEDAGCPDHLLVADECHRYTGDTFSNVFTYPRSASLGLSATPISRGNELTESDELLLGELGEIYYELTYDEGIQRGLIPEFTIQYVGFELADPERREYDALSQKVSNAVKDVRQTYGHRLDELRGSFAQKLHVIRNNSDGPIGPIADYFQYTQERRELVANAVARQAITLELLREAVETDQKTIVFQERIAQLEQLVSPLESRGEINRADETAADVSEYRTDLYRKFEGLREVDKAIENLFQRTDFWPAMYHSGHSRDIWNDISMDWFREDDMANVMLSVKALIEGVDVPSADIGIVRVSSGSIRQRIQTLGRILRTGEDASKESTLYVLYARDTVDENIFREYDWQEELASANVEHQVWERDDESYATGQIRPATEDEYPPRPTPSAPPEPLELELGDEYEWSREPKKRVSVDSEGRLFEDTRDGYRYFETFGFEEEISFVQQKKGGGEIIVNEHNHLLTILPDGPVFLGEIDGLDVFEETEGNGSLTDDPEDFKDIFG